MSAGGGVEVRARHDAQNNRFVLEGAPDAYLEYVTRQDGAIDLQHTFVSPAYRGRGYAALLVDAAFSYAREQDAKIVPTCSYIATYLRKNPQRAEQVQASDRDS